jgi:hypothetical protein
MRKIIELLEKAKADTVYLLSAGGWIIPDTWIRSAIKSIEKAIAELKNKPRWETPEQYKKRTGANLPDDTPVWSRYHGHYIEPWSLGTYGETEELIEYWKERGHDNKYDIVIATDAGLPPDDWKPEEEK